VIDHYDDWLSRAIEREKQYRRGMVRFACVWAGIVGAVVGGCYFYFI
jgi:hypothetical protein